MQIAQVCGTRKYDLEQILQKLASWQKDLFGDDCLRLKICSFNQKALCSIPVGVTWKGGFDDRTDQNDQKVEFRYPPPNLSMSNLGTPRTQEISSLWNFPNSQLYQKLNVQECWRINYLIFIGQFSVLSVPRLYTAYFCPVFVVLCTFA